MGKFNFDKDVMGQSQVYMDYARKFTNNSIDAEDLLQDTFIKVVSYIDSYKEGTNLKGWIYTIMRNTFINSYRRKTISQGLVSQKEELNSADLSQSAVSNQAEQAFIGSDIQEALKKLPESYYTPFIMYFEGYKYYEIAEHLKIPDGTVKTRIHVARKMLQKDLAQYKMSRSL